MGPNNTNTPTPTPDTGNAPGATPVASPTPPTPAFSGPAPTTNPFSSQNIIPSSATGDIKLTPDPTPKKSKKGLIIFLLSLLAIASIVLAVVLVSANNQSTSQTQPAESTPVSLRDLQSSFNTLANTLISGEQASTTPNLTLASSDWQITKIANNTSNTAADSQAAYAATLLSAEETFSSNLVNYISQNPNTDLTSLEATGTALNDKIIASILFLRGNKFSLDLPTIYLEDSENISSIIDEEFSLDYGVSDESAANLVINIASYYDQIIERTRIFSENGCVSNNKINEACVANLRADYDSHPDLQIADEFAYVYATTANDAFAALVNELPASLSEVNSSLGGLND